MNGPSPHIVVASGNKVGEKACANEIGSYCESVLEW